MGDTAVVNHGKAESAAKEVLKRLARGPNEPYKSGIKEHVCAFFIKGNCKRGVACPFKHEKPEERILPEHVKERIRQRQAAEGNYF